MGDIALPSSEKLRALAQALGTTPEDLLEAAGYIERPSSSSHDLPDIKVYLRRKYALQDARTLQAIETIVSGLIHKNGGSAKSDQAVGGRSGRNRQAATADRQG